MGGLWVDYNLMSNVPGSARHRRSEFFRSRREPARRQRAHARSGRRLFCSALHACRIISPARSANGLRLIIRNFKKAEDEVRARIKKLLDDQWQALGRFVPSRAGPAALGQMRHGAQRSRLARSARDEFRSCAKNFGTTCASRATAKSSINRSNAPAASPTFSNSPN